MTSLKEEFINFYTDLQYADAFLPSKEAIIADWWITKLSSELSALKDEVKKYKSEFPEDASPLNHVLKLIDKRIKE